MPTLDVVVVGGGPSGIAAAIAAARNGASTGLIERYGFLGGNAAAGMVGNLCGFYTSGAAKSRVVGGIGWELVQELLARGAAIELFESGDDQGIGLVPYNHEALKVVADHLVHDAGIRLLLHSLTVDVVRHGNAIVGIAVESKSGRQIIRGRVFVDASGDGDVAFKAGADCMISEQPQAMTTIFSMANVDLTEAMAVRGPALRDLLKEESDRGRLSLPRLHVGFIPIPGMPGVVAANMTRVQQSRGLDATGLTEAEIEGRRQVMLYADVLRRCVPGFEQAFVVATAVQVGVRETRRIRGVYVLTEQDVLGARRFADGVGCNAWPLELHDSEAGGEVLWSRLPSGESHDIPYRSLLPRGVDGLLVAGRCASTSHYAQASTRVTGPCMAMGQAAGTAAAISARNMTPPSQLDVGLLRRTLRAQGAILG